MLCPTNKLNRNNTLSVKISRMFVFEDLNKKTKSHRFSLRTIANDCVWLIAFEKLALDVTSLTRKVISG